MGIWTPSSRGRCREGRSQGPDAMPGTGLFFSKRRTCHTNLAICFLHSAPSPSSDHGGFGSGCPVPTGPSPHPLPLPRDDEVPGPTPMELEAKLLPEPPVQMPSLEPMVPPLEETVSCWRKGSVRDESERKGTYS